MARTVGDFFWQRLYDCGVRRVYGYPADGIRMASAWDEALASDRPVVLEVRTDPNDPPQPPHITIAQAKAFMSTLLKGDPDQGSVLMDTAKEVLSGILPGRKL